MSTNPFTVAPYLRQHEPSRRSGVRHQDWRDLAACRTEDPALFFPPEGGGRKIAAEAKSVCARCPVTAQCLQFALASPERHGIFGGLSERERQGMKPARTGPAMCGNDLHVMTPENTYTEPGRDRKACRACKAAANRSRDQRTRYERESVAA